MKCSFTSRLSIHLGLFLVALIATPRSWGVEVLVPVGSVWKYLDNGSDLGTEWVSPAFDDSSWASGPAQLGFGDGDEATVVSFGNETTRYVTTYFRRAFGVTNSASVTGLTVRLLRDDGGVVYLNGVEIFRSNMPTGAISSATLALSTVAGPDEMTTFFEAFVPPSLLVNGFNSLAVEIHQVNVTSSDMSFDLELLANVSAITNPPPVAPTIVTQPQSQTALAGANVIFNVTATGTPPLQYQWLFNGNFIPGATNSAFSLFNIQTANEGDYSVAVSNSVGITFSSNAVLQVLINTNPPPVPPTIVTQPQSQTVVAGSAVAFFVEVTGTPPFSYRWRRNGTTIPGATNASLTLLNVQTNQAGLYSVVVTNLGGFRFSSNAVLQVLASTNPTPTVTLTSPANGATFTAPAVILLSASVSPPGSAARVEFFAGTNQIAQDLTTPFTQVWSNVPPGSYQLRAVATDSNNNAFVSSLVNIMVENPSTGLTLISTGAVWRYLDDGSDQGTAWTSPAFNDSAWASGPAQLGYGDGDEATIVGFGPDPANKYITTYFRKPFAVTNTSSITGLTARLLRDDGAVVYLNGVEVFRSNMPDGPVAFNTLALLAVDESTYVSAPIPRGLLVAGMNVVAVEVHQTTPVSSDLSFDLELTAQTSGGPAPVPPTIVTQPQSRTVNVGANTSFNVVATGSPLLIYRWRRDGTNIAVTTNGTLNLINVQLGQAGSYSVVVGNFVGSVTSAPALLTVVDTNRPPIADSQSVTVSEDSSIWIFLSGSDPDGNFLTFTIVSPPSHGTLSGAAPTNATARFYRPAPNYFGPDSFAFAVSDGLARATGVVSITVVNVNDPPFARASVSPLTMLFPDQTNSFVISPNNSNAPVVLDASLSSDPESDPLGFAWIEEGVGIATGITVTNQAEVGLNFIILVVDDGTDTATDFVLFEVITAGDAVDEILQRLENSTLPRAVRRPLVATLRAAQNSFDVENSDAGVQRLQAFQNKVEMRVAPVDPGFATLLVDAAQKIIDAVNAP